MHIMMLSNAVGDRHSIGGLFSKYMESMIVCGCPNMTHASACAVIHLQIHGSGAPYAIRPSCSTLSHSDTAIPQCAHHWFYLGRSLPLSCMVVQTPPPIMAQWHPYVPPSHTIIPHGTMSAG